MQMLFDAISGKTEASTSADAPVEAASKDDPELPRPAKKRGSYRSRIKGLDQLPVETEEVIPDLVAADPDAFERIGEEVSEQLDFIPAKVIRRITVRPKFRRKAQRNLPPIVAPAPVTPLLGGLPSAALLAFMLVSKYIDHLPLYRQEQIFLRAGVGIPRDLIIHWIHKAISLLDPVVQAIRRETLTSDYIQVDETTARYLSPGAGKAPLGYLWVVNVPGGSLFYHWGVGRGTEQLIETIGEKYVGTIQCDAYSAYTCYQKQQPADVILFLMACLAHIRRNFHEVIESGPHPHAAQILLLIGHLYQIEARLREAKAGPALREAVRASESAMIYKRLGRLMEIMLRRHRPQTPIGRALVYGIGNWERFGVYLTDGRIEIDNNLAENAIRPIKLGHKNWLFFGSKDAGHAAASIYTLVENCRRYGLPVEAYLKQLLHTLPGLTDESVIATLTPARIADVRRRTCRVA
jgi:transposase